MMLLLLSAPIVLVGLFYLYMKTMQYIYSTRVYNIKTGERLYHRSILTFFTQLLFDDKSRSLLVKSTEAMKGHGPIVLGWIFFQPAVSIQSHEFAAHVLKNPKIFEKVEPIVFKEGGDFLGKQHLVLVNGNTWTRQRKILDPAFGSSLGNYEHIFEEKTKIVLDRLKDNQGIINNTNEITQQMALDILGLSIFGHDFGSLQGKSKKDLMAYNRLMHSINSPSDFMYYLMKEKFLPWTRNSQVQESLDVFNELCERLIEESKKSESKTFSMLDLMVASQSQEDGLSDIEIRDNISIFFLAGHETTANALAFAIHTLAEHPEIQIELRDTIRKEIANNRNWKYEDIKNIEDLNCFIKENMRLWPPIAVVPAKKTSQDTQIGDVFVPKDHLVSINIWAIQRSEDVYEDAETFKPSRWRRSENKKYPMSAWIPFSAGPRICIGNDFSLMEQRIFLVEFLLNYSVSKVNPNDKMDVDPSVALFQSPRNYPLKFETISK